MRSRQAKRSMEELGLQRKEIIFAYAWQFGKLFLVVLVLHLISGILWGKIGGYVTGYGALLEKQACYALLQEDAVYRGYAAFMGGTMLAFGMLVMGAFVCVHFYVDWEQNKYAYGVFRSMGMPYRTLYRKLILRYMTGIVFAWPAACFVVEEFFGNSFTAGQVFFSGSLLFILVEICYSVLYYVYKNRRICDMLQDG